MILTERIQKSVGQAILLRNSKKLSRKRFIHNLNTAEKVGVVFSPRNTSELKTIKSFLAFLKKLEIKVYPLAFMDHKRHDINIIMESRINFVDRKDFNWFHKPLSPALTNFIKHDFDILINLGMYYTLPINYIISLSRAKLKVGKYFENKESFCDLMIDVKDSKDLSYLIEQTSHYLSVINSIK